MRAYSWLESFKKALIAILGKAIFSEVDHDQRLKEVERLREIDSLLRTEREAGNELTARYLERCHAEVIGGDDAHRALDFTDSLLSRCESGTGFLRALPNSDDTPRPKRRGRSAEQRSEME